MNLKKVEPDDLSIIHDGDLEIYVLGCTILDPDLLPNYCWLPPAAFWLDDHRKVWKAMVELHHQGQRPEMTRLATALVDTGVFKIREAMDKVAYILDASMAYQPTIASVDPYFDLLVETYRKRRLDEFAYQIRSKIRVKDSDWKHELQEGFSEIFQDGATTENLFKPLNECDLSDDTEPPAITTGLSDVDALWDGGIKPGELVILAARPSMGKSAMMCWLSLAAAAKGYNVSINSVEMSMREIKKRWCAAVGGFPYNAWRNIPKEARLKAEQRVNEIAQITVNSTSSSTQAVLASLHREILSRKVDVIFIDHLHHIVKSADEQACNDAARFATDLKNLAKDSGTAIVLLCQLNRGVESRTDKRPTMGDIRQFGSLEQIADSIIMLYRDEKYNPQTVDKNITEMIFVKNRNGRIGTVKVLDELAVNRYYDLTDNNYAYVAQNARTAEAQDEF